MFKYRGFILIAIPAILAIALLLAWPDIIRSYPLVIGIALGIGILAGVLAAMLRGRPDDEPADNG